MVISFASAFGLALSQCVISDLIGLLRKQNADVSDRLSGVHRELEWIPPLTSLYRRNRLNPTALSARGAYSTGAAAPRTDVRLLPHVIEGYAVQGFVKAELKAIATDSRPSPLPATHSRNCYDYCLGCLR